MATLSGNINASQRNIRVADGEAVTPSLRLRVDDELIDFIRFEPYPYINGLRQKGLDPTQWWVTRGVGNSVAASHLSGATLTAAIAAAVSSETLIPPDPFADAVGGGAIAVDNTVDPPAEVTTLIAPGADVSTPGEADLSTAEGVQRVRLLGPFDISSTIPDESTWPDVHHFGETLAAGTLVTKLLVLPTVQWVSVDADVTLNLGIGVPGDINNTGNDLFRLVVRIGGVSQGVSTLPWTGTKTFRNALTSPLEVTVDQPGIFVAAGQMLAYLSHPCSAGSARVYVHVEEPSA